MFGDDNNKKKFDLIDELARGAIYRGGEDQEQFLIGYGKGMIGCVVFCVVMWVVGSIVQHFR